MTCNNHKFVSLTPASGTKTETFADHSEAPSQVLQVFEDQNTIWDDEEQEDEGNFFSDQHPSGSYSVFSFPSSIVGRRFLPGNGQNFALQPGMRLDVIPEKDNCKDKNALLVIFNCRDENGDRPVPFGYLPATVARSLGPIVRKGAASIEVVITEIPAGEKASIRVDVEVVPMQTKGHSVRAAYVGVREAVNSLKGSTPSTGEGMRHNFSLLVAEVLKHDSNIIMDTEMLFLQRFNAVSSPAQSLFLHMFLRDGPVFRVGTLNYSYLSEPLKAISELEAESLVSCASVDKDSKGCFDCTDLVSTLTVPELEPIVRRVLRVRPYLASKSDLSDNRKTAVYRRSTVVDVLSKFLQIGNEKDVADLRHRLLLLSGPVVRLDAAAVLAMDRFQRIFFLNEGHSLAQFLATDSGAVRYPTYSITRKRSAFQTRQAFEDYEHALRLASTMTQAIEEEDWDSAEGLMETVWAALDSGLHKTIHLHSDTPLFLRRYSAAWVYCLMATAAISILERQKRFREAIDRLQQLLGGLCCPSRRGLWWLRLSINLEHINRPGDSLEMAETALADDSLSPGYRLALQRRILRLGKPPRRWRRPAWAASAEREPREVRIEGRPLTNSTGLKSRFYGFDGDQCTVEELALQYYSTPEGGSYRGIHSEGGVWSTLFGILLWPALFQIPIEDAFRTPFQTAPLDLDSESFYDSRKESINDLLNQISAGQARLMIESVWRDHYGVMCRGVQWERWTLGELEELVDCIPGPGLAAVCRLLAQDHGGWRGGMPDLFLWNLDKKTCKLSEVKGPRDRLSDQQRAWLAVLEDSGLDVEVLKVVEPTATTRQR